MLTDPTLKIDWFRVVTDLCEHGYSHATIAASVGVAKGTISSWKSGATPAHDDGERLLALWRDVMVPPAPPVPTVPRFSHRA